MEFLIRFIKDLKAKYGISVKFIRLNNAGGNKAFEDASLREGLGIQFEYTSPNSPQYNGKVERKFATLQSKVRAMLNGAGLDEDMRGGLWSEAAKAATDFENLFVS